MISQAYCTWLSLYVFIAALYMYTSGLNDLDVEGEWLVQCQVPWKVPAELLQGGKPSQGWQEQWRLQDSSDKVEVTSYCTPSAILCRKTCFLCCCKIYSSFLHPSSVPLLPLSPFPSLPSLSPPPAVCDLPLCSRGSDRGPPKKWPFSIVTWGIKCARRTRARVRDT